MNASVLIRIILIFKTRILLFHITMARDEAIMAKLNDVPEFLAFRKALKASGPLSPPRSTKLNLIGAGFEF